MRGAAAGRVAREGGVNVAVGENQVAAVQQRHDLAFAAVREIGGVQQGERGGGQQPALFSAAGGGLHQRRGIPFGEVDAIAADFQPALQQIELGAFSRAVNPFDDH